jgi:hypothetical protein
MASTRALGIGLIILSGLFWAAIPVVHLFHLSAWWTAAADATLLVAAELAFWPGSVLLGASFKEKLRALWHPRSWFHR